MKHPVLSLSICLLTLPLAACGDDKNPDEAGDEIGTETGESGESGEETAEGESGTAEGSSSESSSESSESSEESSESSESSEEESSESSESSEEESSESSESSEEESSESSESSEEESSESSDTNDCIPTEDIEVTCDKVDNDCDGFIDDIDVGNDGFCDCLAIGILGATGFAPTSDFEAWLEDQGTSVARHLLANNPGVVTPELLANYDVVLVDRIERALSPEEAAALEAFVKQEGKGVITLIGYNFDNGNPAPERDRANTALAPFGLAYQGGYIHTQFGVTPSFDQMHPIGMGIVDINYHGGIVTADTGNQGNSVIFATVPSGDAGLAHETADGGRVIVWGDEWITFDSDWAGFADVQEFWAQMVGWVKPKEFCGAPQ